MAGRYSDAPAMKGTEARRGGLLRSSQRGLGAHASIRTWMPCFTSLCHRSAEPRCGLRRSAHGDGRNPAIFDNVAISPSFRPASPDIDGGSAGGLCYRFIEGSTFRWILQSFVQCNGHFVSKTRNIESGMIADVNEWRTIFPAVLMRGATGRPSIGIRGLPRRVWRGRAATDTGAVS